MSKDALELLIEALGGDMARIAAEIEKLALYAGEREVTVDDMTALAPDARSTTIFALVNALGRKDRMRALEALDTLTREGEYLPLALAFLVHAVSAGAGGARSGVEKRTADSVAFSRIGIPMWGSRADQI